MALNSFKDLPRHIIYFEKVSEQYVGSIDIPKEIDPRELQILWKQPEDDPMIYSYPILTLEQIKFIEKVLQCKLETEKYDYFLEPS